MVSKGPKAGTGKQQQGGEGRSETPSEPKIAFDWPAHSGLRLKLRRNEYIAAEELADALEKDRGAALPDNVLDYVIRLLRGEVKKPRGRPKPGAAAELREYAVLFQYDRYVRWLQRRKARFGLAGWPRIRDAKWWQGPPHERAVRMVAYRFRRGWPNVTPQHIRIVISPRKSRLI